MTSTTISSREEDLAFLEGIIATKGKQLEGCWQTANQLSKDFQELDFSQLEVLLLISLGFYVLLDENPRQMVSGTNLRLCGAILVKHTRDGMLCHDEKGCSQLAKVELDALSEARRQEAKALAQREELRSRAECLRGLADFHELKETFSKR
jgi:hypothetical protein